VAIQVNKIKFYRCSQWSEGSDHGGDIDTANEIASGADQNIFDDVSDAQRVAGSTEYRKIYVRNENDDTWLQVVAWIAQFTPAENDEIAIALGTNSGTVSSEGSGATYVSPDAKDHADALNIGDLAKNAYQAIWIRRKVTAGGDGYSNNSFTLAFESS